MSLVTTDKSPTADNDSSLQLTALNGVRFFAVFHIFLFHLRAIRRTPGFTSAMDGRFADVFAGLDTAPRWLDNFLAHGYVSTSFFFVLSGFILSYLYWSPGGDLATPRRRFWVARASRVYPAHLIVLAISLLLFVPRMVFDPTAPSVGLFTASAVATATLTQAWMPPLVPVLAWPTWALSALVFLYLVMPSLMSRLARLGRKHMIALLAALPAVSLVPTLVFLLFFPDGGKDDKAWTLFIGCTPLFWVPHFAAGMLLSRLFGISRFEVRWRERSRGWLSFGDLAFLALVAVCLSEPASQPWRHILRHGLLMPLYLPLIHDFALGRGVFARLFSLPGMGFLGQTSFSIFIWQGFLTAVSFIVAYANAAAAPAALWIAIVGLLVVSIMSTYWIEKPIARRLRRRYAEPRAIAVRGELAPAS